MRNCVHITTLASKESLIKHTPTQFDRRNLNKSACAYLLHDGLTHHLHRCGCLHILHRFSRNRIDQPSGTVPEVPNLVNHWPDPVRQIRVILSGEFEPALDNVRRWWREATRHVVPVDCFANLSAHEVALGGCFEHLKDLFASGKD